jgi:hypothetical protein
MKRYDGYILRFINHEGGARQQEPAEVYLASEVDAERKEKDRNLQLQCKYTGKLISCLDVAKKALEEIGDAALVAKTRNDCVHIALKALARIVELEGK